MAHGSINGPFPNGLNPRQEAFAEAYLANGGNASQAVLAAGYSPSTPQSAASQGSDLLSKPDIQSRIRDLADRAGLSIAACVDTLKRKLQAQKPIVVGKKVELFDDNAAQIRAAELGLRVHGAISSGEQSNTVNNFLSLTKYDNLTAKYHDQKS